MGVKYTIKNLTDLVIAQHAMSITVENYLWMINTDRELSAEQKCQFRQLLQYNFTSEGVVTKIAKRIARIVGDVNCPQLRTTWLTTVHFYFNRHLLSKWNLDKATEIQNDSMVLLESKLGRVIVQRTLHEIRLAINAVFEEAAISQPINVLLN